MNPKQRPHKFPMFRIETRNTIADSEHPAALSS
jgi:hypothetical protein